jgi:2-ketoarginine methyltransferase
VIADDFELRLIQALRPVRYYFLAQVTWFALSSGLVDLLDQAGPCPLEDVARKQGFTLERTRALLRYLANEGLVSGPDSELALTAAGRELITFRPWYELLIGGYAETLTELPTVMAEDTAYAGRNGVMVGQGSCGISRFDAIPLARRLMASLPAMPDTIVDLGCGDGTFLTDLCEGGVRGIGVDPNQASIALGQRRVEESGHALHITLVAGSAEAFLSRAEVVLDGVTCYVAAFSLQEVLEQQGRDVVLELIRTALRSTPEARLIVIEVDRRPSDPTVMRHGLGAAYYNPYYLIHEVTEQRLETAAFWRQMFADASASVDAWFEADPRVDSTRLEFGCLLSSAAP